MTLFSTAVICAGPETCPHTINEDLMFLSVRLAKGTPVVLGGDWSMTLCLMCDTVPDGVLEEAEAGVMCTLLWLDTLTPLLSCSWAIVSSCMVPGPAFPFSFAFFASSFAQASCSAFSCVGDSLSSGVVTKLELTFDESD